MLAGAKSVALPASYLICPPRFLCEYDAPYLVVLHNIPNSRYLIAQPGPAKVIARVTFQKQHGVQGFASAYIFAKVKPGQDTTKAVV